MANNTLKLEIITPDEVAVQDEALSIVLPGSDGLLGILPNHAPLIAALKPGSLDYKNSQGEQFVFVAGGFVEVSNNLVSIISPAAERYDGIDVARAEHAKERAIERLKQKDNVDRARAEAALARAVARLHTAAKR